MAITKGAKKSQRVSLRRRVINDKRRASMKDAVKSVRQGVTLKAKDLRTELSLAFKELDKAVKLGVIKKGNANRKKSRLAKAIAKMSK